MHYFLFGDSPELVGLVLCFSLCNFLIYLAHLFDIVIDEVPFWIIYPIDPFVQYLKFPIDTF